ncbi:amino acid transporter [Cryptosporidium ubiquitum]|uniref:Amino acid transporter n=1 Tax=Cryptosporidium ubiquitum TaxID=857276 RepID=A0A1J4MD46_9CRYT|nr:amino acid transporter [Cryptosporidium ubiquitum]OII70932.1 amino acid transporter [Cryptosporidium ubiquitum]
MNSIMGKPLLEIGGNERRTLSKSSISSYKTMNRTQSMAIYGLFEDEPETLPGLGGAIQGSSLSEAVSAMVNTMLGIGTLAIPLAYAANGLLQGILLTFFCAFLSSLSLYLLSSIAMEYGDDVSFYSVTSNHIPGLKWIVDSAIVIKSLGVSTSYLMVVGDLVYSLFFYNNSYGIDPKVLRAIVLLTSVVFFIAPASFPHKLKSMKYTNWLSVICILYVVLVVFFRLLYNTSKIYLSRFEEQPALITGNLDYFSTFSLRRTLETFPILIFAFTCQQNIFTVSNELHDRTLNRLSKIIIVSIGTGILVYCTIGISGYLLFGRLINKANVLELFKTNTFDVFIAKLFIAVSMVFSFPIQCHPCRRSLSILLYSGVTEMEPKAEKRALNLITIFILVLTTSCAIYFTNLGLAYELVGTICSNTTAFIIPSLLYIKVFKHKGLTIEKFLAFFLLIMAIMILILCLSAIFIGLLKK